MQDFIKVKKNIYQIHPVWKGLIPYTESVALQEDLKATAKGTTQAFFIGFECPACVTLGLRGKAAEDLVCTEEEYRKKEVSVVSIKRGGQATLHSPGQLVIYPVMDLRLWNLKPRDFLRLLERITENTLAEYGVAASSIENSAGLFTNNGKIAFFGVHISEGVSQHGLALNVANDLSLFNLIRSCGETQREHDSLQTRGISCSVKDVFFQWCQKAQSIFIPVSA